MRRSGADSICLLMQSRYATDATGTRLMVERGSVSHEAAEKGEWATANATSHADAVGNRATGRPNRSYKIGTTIMFSAVELNRPNMMTMAIGA